MFFFWVKYKHHYSPTAIRLIEGSFRDLSYYKDQGQSWSLNLGVSVPCGEGCTSSTLGDFFSTQALAISAVESLDMIVFLDSPSFGTFAV